MAEMLGNGKPKKMNTKLRAFLFFFFIVLAIAVIGYGAYKTTNKEPGEYTIEANPAEESLFYASGITYKMYLTGTGNEIKDTLKAVSGEYSALLLRAYKLTDPVNEYEGFVNLATINKALERDKEFSGTLPEELFTMLYDAVSKTKEGKGYNVFAGYVNEFWRTLFSLSDPYEFDPAENPHEAERLRVLSEISAPFGLFTVSFGTSSEKTVKLAISSEFYEKKASTEQDGGLLDFGVLREAYMLKYAAEALWEKGYRNGTISTVNGLTISFTESEESAYALYTVSEGDVKTTDVITVNGTSVASEMRAFRYSDEFGSGYAMKGKFYRHPYYSGLTGDFTDLLMSSLTVKGGLDTVSAVYNNYLMQVAETEEDVKALLEEWKKTGEGAYNLQ